MKLKLDGSKEFHYSLVNEKGSSCEVCPCKGEGSEHVGLSPMEMVAGGVAGCVLIDVQIILKKQRVDAGNIQVEIVGKRTGGVPSPFESIDLNFIVNENLDIERLRKNIQLVIDKYCSVSASLNPVIEISFTINGK
jgi:putative redox protein